MNYTFLYGLPENDIIVAILLDIRFHYIFVCKWLILHYHIGQLEIWNPRILIGIRPIN